MTLDDLRRNRNLLFWALHTLGWSAYLITQYLGALLYEKPTSYIKVVLAAAVVVFFLAPLQRFAERVASSAMPNTENTPEYAAFRKMQVYESAVAEARGGGGISAKERSLLNTLRESLGISEYDAAAIERELEARANGTTNAHAA